jgi:hypothetical protein
MKAASLLLFAGLPLLAQGFDKNVSGGSILKASGPSVVIKLVSSGKTVQAHSRDPLHVGDLVICGAKSSAIIDLVIRQVPVAAGHTYKAVPLPVLPSKKVQNDDRDAMLARRIEAKNAEFSPGGQRVSDPTLIWCPIASSCVDPETFTPRFQLTESQVAILTSANQAEWSFEGDGKPIPDSEVSGLREKLGKLQQPNDRVSLRFTVRYRSVSYESPFELISKGEKSQLQRKLAACDGETDAYYKILERAAAFGSFALLNDRLNELEKLRGLYPDSSLLLAMIRDEEEQMGIPTRP